MDEFRVVRSRDNPLVKILRKLASSSRERRKTGSAILEGEHLVCALRDAGLSAQTLAATESALRKPSLRALFIDTPASSRVVLDDRLIGEISQVMSASGLIAVVQAPDPGPIPRDAQNCLLLESIQDPGNLGSILRTAAAAGVRRILLSPGSVFAWSPKVLRAGMGAHFRLTIFENADLPSYAGEFPGKVIATSSTATVPLYECRLDGPVAWAFGNEGAGLSAELIAISAIHVRIPMPGGVESLNVAAGAAICVFEKLRQDSAAVADPEPRAAKTPS